MFVAISTATGSMLSPGNAVILSLLLARGLIIFITVALGLDHDDLPHKKCRCLLFSYVSSNVFCSVLCSCVMVHCLCFNRTRRNRLRDCI